MARKTVVTIIRHGETDYNKAGIVQGHLDVPLNAEGLAQASVTGRWFAQQRVRFEEGWSSDLARARKTAELILEQQREKGVQLRLDERIRERHLGNLQGKRRGEPGTDRSTVEPIHTLRARLWSFWDSLFPPTGPSDSSAPSSLSSSVSSLAPPAPPSTSSRSLSSSTSSLLPQGRQILYVSHGAAIREFVSSLVEYADRGERDIELVLPKQEAEMIRKGSKRIDNCSRTVIEMEWVEDEEGSGHWHSRLVLYADDTHFIDSSRAPSPTENADVVE
ncbi:hypothetical protein JCM10049v2_001914 [Rhodotorula toruloides]